MILKQTEDGIVLCCGRGRCPVLKEVDEDHITITDDNGDSIFVRKDQASLITKAIKLLDQ
tara:strand:- start:350 stop:529 length:180 start_codon:yes stop_codon:yes gene_type:complete